MSSGLRLEPVTQDNVRGACQLKLRPDQENLVAPVAWSLADAYTVPDIAWPRVIYDGDQLVGFIMAVFDLDNPDDLFHSYLVRLNIGAEHQGSGYGSFAVEGLCQEAARRCACRRIRGAGVRHDDVRFPIPCSGGTAPRAIPP
jgi:diamine N-acetyltransferase